MKHGVFTIVSSHLAAWWRLALAGQVATNVSSPPLFLEVGSSYLLLKFLKDYFVLLKIIPLILLSIFRSHFLLLDAGKVRPGHG